MGQRKIKVWISREKYDAVVFDLDGVVTKTAHVHGKAWKELFDTFLKTQEGPFVPFTEEDYLQFVDGKPRYEGVQSFLEARGITLPFGDPEDPPSDTTVCGLGNKKNLFFREQLEKNGVDVYGSTVTLIDQLKQQGVRVGLITSSKNCDVVLKAAGLSDLFEVKIDGVIAQEEGIKGKPSGDVFLEAVRILKVRPPKAVVVEDALSGVAAGRDGGFGMVIGVDRVGQEKELLEHGATVVVQDLSEVEVGQGPKESQANALEHFEEIANEVKGKKLVVFLDYDGTLSPIVSSPELALLTEPARKTLMHLAAAHTVAILSGRDRKDVEKLVGIDGLHYAGSHGFDISGPEGLRFENEKGRDFLPVLDEAEEKLKKALSPVEGAWVERKKYSVAIHYRQVSEEAVSAVKEAVSSVHQRLPTLRQTCGKKIYELQPNIDWHKGKALLWLLEFFGLSFETAVPIFIGDDVTDEDGFEVLREKGIGIAVRETPSPTAARYVLKSPDEVRQFLEKLGSL